MYLNKFKSNDTDLEAANFKNDSIFLKIEFTQNHHGFVYSV